MKKNLILKIALLLILVLLSSIAVATLIENKFSSELSWQLVYSSIWFELLIILITFLMTLNFIRIIVIKKEFKLGSFVLHMAILLIVIGGISKKHIGFQGEMYLSKNEKSNVSYSKDYYMILNANKKDQSLEYIIKGNDSFEHDFDIFGKTLNLKNKYYYQYIKQNIVKDEENGYGVMDFEIILNNSRKHYIFEEFGKLNLENLKIYFNKEPQNLNSPYIKIVSNQHQMINFKSNIDVVSNFEEVYEKNKIHEFHPGILYKIGKVQLLADKITTLGRVQTEFDKTKQGKSALFSSVKFDNILKEVILNESGKHYSSYKKSLFYDDIDIELNWGKLENKLPFFIKLNEFDIKRYYGSNIVSSYESKISLFDLDGNRLLAEDIKVNEPLRYKGFSIFQTTSSMYGGTVLHVNYNPTFWILYLGYFLLCLGLIIILFSKNSYFSRLKQSL